RRAKPRRAGSFAGGAKGLQPPGGGRRLVRGTARFRDPFRRRPSDRASNYARHLCPSRPLLRFFLRAIHCREPARSRGEVPLSSPKSLNVLGAGLTLVQIHLNSTLRDISEVLGEP